MYNELADLIETKKPELARLTAAFVIENNISSYIPNNIEAAAQNFERTIEMIVQYLRDGDVQAWRNYIVAASERPLRQGLSVEEINAIGVCTTGKIKELIEEQFSAVEQHALKARYMRRIDGLASVAQISVLYSEFKQGINR